jgi:hypothetical protein
MRELRDRRGDFNPINNSKIQGGNMRKIAIASIAISFAMVSVAWGGAKDKSSNTLVEANDPQTENIIDNTLGKTKTKSKGCTLQISAKPANLGDGAVVICIAEADVAGIGGNSIVLAGEAKSGQFKIKADMSEVKFATLGCGDIDAVSYNGNLRCFTDDPIFRGDATGPGSWRDQCVAAGMLASPLPGDAPGATKLKVNNAQSIVVGICQGFFDGDRILPPASPEFARQGQRTGIIP